MKRCYSFTAIFLVFSYVLLTSCASVNLTPQASKIEIISEERAKNYEFIGYVRGSSLRTGMFNQQGYENAINELLNNAATIGAQYVVLDPGSKPTYWTMQQIVHGKAYRVKNQ